MSLENAEDRERERSLAEENIRAARHNLEYAEKLLEEYAGKFTPSSQSAYRAVEAALVFARFELEDAVYSVRTLVDP